MTVTSRQTPAATLENGSGAVLCDLVSQDDILPASDRMNPKVRQLLDAAHLLFLDQPYDAVSTDSIAKAAKVSKATLYAHFASKEALFAALIGERCSQIAADLWTSTSDCGDVEAVLRKIARNFVQMFATCEALDLYRVIIAQVPRFPELGRMFYESGPEIMQKRISSFLAASTKRGLLDIDDADLAAVQFLQLVAGDLPLTGMLGLGAKTPREVDRIVDGGVALFMAGYGPKVRDAETVR